LNDAVDILIGFLPSVAFPVGFFRGRTARLIQLRPDREFRAGRQRWRRYLNREKWNGLDPVTRAYATVMQSGWKLTREAREAMGW
jgi:hypothetical protein